MVRHYEFPGLAGTVDLGVTNEGVDHRRAGAKAKARAKRLTRRRTGDEILDRVRGHDEEREVGAAAAEGDAAEGDDAADDGNDDDFAIARRAGDALLDGAALRRDACSQPSQALRHVHHYKAMSCVERAKAQAGSRCSQCEKRLGLGVAWVCVDDCPDRSVLCEKCNGGRRDIL